MRFILTSNGMEPTTGAILPELLFHTTQTITDSVTLSWIHAAGIWIAHSGLPLLAEGLMVFSLFCFLMAITGQGKWMERGVKSIIGFALIGGAAHAF